MEHLHCTKHMKKSFWNSFLLLAVIYAVFFILGTVAGMLQSKAQTVDTTQTYAITGLSSFNSDGSFSINGWFKVDGFVYTQSVNIPAGVDSSYVNSAFRNLCQMYHNQYINKIAGQALYNSYIGINDTFKIK